MCGRALAQLRRHLKKELAKFGNTRLKGGMRSVARRVHQQLEAALVDFLDGGQGKATPCGWMPPRPTAESPSGPPYALLEDTVWIGAGK